MKKVLVLLFIAFSLISFNINSTDDCLIKGTVSGINDGEIIYLKESNGSQGLITLDSTLVKNGKFGFKMNGSEIKLCLIIHKDITGFPIVIEKGTITVEINKNETSNSSKVFGTITNDELLKLTTSSKLISEKVNEFTSKNAALFKKASDEKDETTMQKLQKEYDALQKENSDLFIIYAENNPNSFLSAVILESFLSSNAETDFERKRKMYNALSLEIKKTKQGKKVEELLRKIENQKTAKNSLDINAIAPNFSAKTPEGKTISLKECLGKVTIIDFWASWCGPCRRENPSVVALYNEFHSQGLSIVGVSLDQDLNKWKEAIVKDKISWFQVSNIKGWNDPIAILYQIESIPQTYILDSDGKIIAKNLRGDELRTKVKELLSVK
jgi:thiol-disulfide isomerase/thioredoxin